MGIGQAEQAAIELDILFCSHFGQAVERRRCQWFRFAQGHFRIIAIDGGRRRIDEFLYTLTAALFQDIDQADDVEFGIFLGWARE
mgnify:CR=1 FL=1